MAILHTYPMLSRVAELSKHSKLSNVLVLACQHLLEPQLRMFEFLIGLGLKPENVIIAGKAYSTNSFVAERFAALGCVVAPFSAQFEPRKRFDDWFSVQLEMFVREQLVSRDLASYEKVVVLDDGGFMHDVVHRIVSNVSNVRGVEQTSSGHHHIEALNVQFPVTSVARSHHKLQHESPFIGDLGHRLIKHVLAKAGREDPNILVLGMGPIGRSILKRFFVGESKRRGMVYDWASTDILRSPAGQELDLMPRTRVMSDADFRGSSLKRFDVIIGATGARSIQESELGRLHPQVLLVSMSSSDREFPAEAFPRTGTHDDVVLDGRMLVNGGFPITFLGEPNCIPPAQIELTMSLLMCSLLKAADALTCDIALAIRCAMEHWSPHDGAEGWYADYFATV
jgi:hypothetical protein